MEEWKTNSTYWKFGYCTCFKESTWIDLSQKQRAFCAVAMSYRASWSLYGVELVLRPSSGENTTPFVRCLIMSSGFTFWRLVTDV